MRANKLETLANMAIIFVSVLVCAVILWRFVLPHQSTRPQLKIPVGIKLRLPNIDWESTPRTAVLALQTGCHFCTESAPVFRSLVAAAHKRNIRVIAVLPQNQNEAAKYLSGLGLEVDAVVSLPLKDIGVSGTPTVLFVGRYGSVFDGWIGAVRPQDQDKLLRKL